MANIETPIHRAELMMALSKATDLEMGQPVEHAMASAVLASRLGEHMGLAQAQIGDAFYVALLRYIGCNADTYWLASIVGDEIAFRTDLATLDSADTLAVIGVALRHIKRANPGLGVFALTREYVRGLSRLGQTETSFFPGHCEVAQNLACRLGFGAGVVEAVAQLYARWDGKGVPRVKGDAIHVAARLASLAHDAITFLRIDGVASAQAMARKRSGKAHWPRAVEALLQGGAPLFAGLDGALEWSTVLAADPTPKNVLDAHALDDACEVIADYADIKSPQLLEHSKRVSELASATGERLHLPEGDVALLRRAGWLHDVGKVGLSAALWHRDSPTSQRDLAAAQLHAIHARTVLAAPGALRALGDVAALHHERADGSGFPNGLRGDALPVVARVLAAANAYCELIEERGAFAGQGASASMLADRAAAALKSDATAGRFDQDIVRAVLAAAGHEAGSQTASRAGAPGGLTDREIEVLRLVARGLTVKGVALRLGIAPKTADRHVQNVYTKIGVSTRAGATIFAMQHQLLR
jgi:HD-GYP domain-containing protein (c-di-GMP phosphodiesterase class II)